MIPALFFFLIFHDLYMQDNSKLEPGGTSNPLDGALYLLFSMGVATTIFYFK